MQVTTRIAVISDTHGHVPFALEAVEKLEQLQPKIVLHCGDIGSPRIVGLFRPWPTHYVIGNVDYAGKELTEAIEQAGHTYHGRFGTIECEGVHIAFMHGDDLRRLQQEIGSGRWQIICHGHTHRASLEQHGPTWVLNPGAVYRARPRSIATIEVPELRFETIPLS